MTKKSTYPIKIIKQQGEATLIERTLNNGYPVRGFVPSGEIDLENMEVPVSTGSAMTPFGLPWEDIADELLKTNFGAELSGQLRKAGVFTLDDLNRESRTVESVLRGVLGLYLGNLRQLAHQHEEKEHKE
jgi:hypothetical protein